MEDFLKQLYNTATHEQRYKIAIALGFENAYSRKMNLLTFSSLSRAVLASTCDELFDPNELMSINDLTRDLPIKAIDVYNMLLAEHNIKVHVTNKVELYGQIKGDIVIFVKALINPVNGIKITKYLTHDEVKCGMLDMANDAVKDELEVKKKKFFETNQSNKRLDEWNAKNEKKHEKMLRDNAEIVKKHQAELNKQQAELNKQQAELKKLAAKLARGNSEAMETQHKIDDQLIINEKLGVKLKQVESFGSEFKEMESRITKLIAYHVKLETDNAKLSATNAKLSATNVKLDASNAKLSATNVKLDASNAKLSADHTDLIAAKANLDADYLELQDQHAKLQARIGKVASEIDYLERCLDDARGIKLKLYNEHNYYTADIYALAHTIEELKVKNNAMRKGICYDLNVSQFTDTIRLMQLVKEIGSGNELF